MGVFTLYITRKRYHGHAVIKREVAGIDRAVRIARGWLKYAGTLDVVISQEVR